MENKKNKNAMQNINLSSPKVAKVMPLAESCEQSVFNLPSIFYQSIT